MEGACGGFAALVEGAICSALVVLVVAVLTVLAVMAVGVALVALVLVVQSGEQPGATDGVPAQR
ncbi:hypothetical protein BE21_55905 [Sorangium cellulosum]|uniref:Uncharacterized protein n=1 Tax=Sorangium cellulosum TaxID=56 RepID=A0A150TAS3_SORCE|nr:hypothetical protein BE21_55905 [Sorangium cellulosum]